MSSTRRTWASTSAVGGDHRGCIRTAPARHPRLGMSVARRRRRTLVHVVHNVSIVWIDGIPSHIECRFMCSSSLWNGPIHLLDQVPDGAGIEACSRCDVDEVQTVPEVVYLADDGAHLKVGFTTQLTRRMASLDARCLFFVPGGRDVEALLIEELPPDLVAQGREWLHRDDSTRTTVVRLMERLSAGELHADRQATS